MEKTAFRLRPLISLLTALGFITMSLSGVVAFIVPQGRVAYWTNWTFLGLTKSHWGNIHITTSVLFLVAGIWHLCYNWTPMVRYFSGKVRDGLSSQRELIVALVITLFFTVGAVTKTPPLNYVLDFNSWIKDAWITQKEYEPPFGHAELLSLRLLAKRTSIELEPALAELKRNGITVASDGDTLEKVAKQNRTSPMKIYALMKRFEQPETEVVPDAVAPATTLPKPAPVTRQQKEPAKQAEAVKVKRYTEESILSRFEGKGIGRMHFDKACSVAGIEQDKARRKLDKAGLTIKDSETLREAADRQNTAPIELMKAMLLGEPIPEP